MRRRGGMCARDVAPFAPGDGKASEGSIHSVEWWSCVPVVQWPRTSPFHGGNTGSNPVGDAKKTKDLQNSARKNVGLKRFDKDFRLRETRILLIIPAPRRTHNLPNDSVMGVSLTSVTACVYTSIVTLKLAWRSVS